MNTTASRLLLLVALSACQATGGEGDDPAGSAKAARDGDLPTITKQTGKLEQRPGLFPTYLDSRKAKLYLQLPPPDADGRLAQFLYMEGLTTGLGSNPVGLDRGQVGGPALVQFVRIGDRVLLERPNLGYRAESDDAAEIDATRESFATSVIWATDVVAEDEDGATLIELTSFLVRDAHGVTRTLEQSNQGSWTLDSDRSVLDPATCLAFPDNLEFEARLTFQGTKPGNHVRSTSPDSSAVTLAQHHSFIRLPDDGYRPRHYDPRAGGFAVRYLDYAAGLDESMVRMLSMRHRLEKVDPSAASSPVKEPIVYYVDRGAPEPVRSALVEGASWWAQAFEAAGFEDAFRVEVLPEGAHPLDVRYNVIQWVHRSTRGWSYGNAVADPRTGEILKGHVSLGSLRVRQDRLLFEGLAGTERTGTGLADDPIELALWRIRQLSAHEVGHTLGFSHNFSASTYADRASVMDYPAPLVRVAANGMLDFSDVYGIGIGKWDEVAVAWLYGEFTPGADEGKRLDAILAQARDRGMRYHSDSDARPPGAAQPYANLWDNFGDPVIGLENTLAVRAIALANFGPANLPAGRPMAELEEVLAPLYFHHRYQVDAAVKMLGGVDYDHALNGDGQAPARLISGTDQRRALAGLLGALDADVLDLPDSVLEHLAPRPPGDRGNPEQFEGATAPIFDSLGAAGTAAQLVVGGILQSERCARLVDQHRRDASLPSLEEVLESLTDAAFSAEPTADARRVEVERVVQTTVVRGLIELADGTAPERVRTRAEGRLSRLLEENWAKRDESEDEFVHRRALIDAVLRFLQRDRTPARPITPAEAAPPGSPIGTLSDCSCRGGGR